MSLKICEHYYALELDCVYKIFNRWILTIHSLQIYFLTFYFQLFKHNSVNRDIACHVICRDYGSNSDILSSNWIAQLVC
jgi:hypothetical protein